MTTEGHPPTRLTLTKATPEPGWEPPADATIVIREAAMGAPQRAELQAQEAERLAEVLADALPEGTLQRLVGHVLVRTAGVRMGVAPLGDARRAEHDAAVAELRHVRGILELAWGPGEISHGHAPRVLADLVVARLKDAEGGQSTVAKLERIRRTLTDALGVEGAHDAEALAEVAAQKLGGGS
jgi:hypothetical protein